MRAWTRTVRVRVTVGAVAVVAAALAVGAVALVVVLRSTLTDQVAAAAELRAEEVAAQLRAGEVPSLSVGEDDEQLLQVLDADGRVVAASANAAGLGPVVAPDQDGTVQVTVRLLDVDDLDDDLDDDRDDGSDPDAEPDGPELGDPVPVIAATASVDTGSGPRTVVAASSTEEVDEAVEVVTGLVVPGAPLLLVVVTVTTWIAAGRALAPVEAARREVDAITAADLHRRLPEPAGRDEIARLVATLNTMLGRLEEAQARQRRFLSDASHELRSPVATLRQHAEVAVAHPEATTLADLAQTVAGESVRLQRLVEDLLLLARADEHRIRLHRRPVDLDDAVFAEAARLRREHPHRIDTTAVGPARLDGDPAALDRVVRNLADNAARHARTTVAFALREEDGTVVLTVDDDGAGIPVADRHRVLERFVRLDEARARARDAGGAGLGLAIVAELVAAHGGVIEVADAPLGGARFTVRLAATPTQATTAP